MSPYHIAKEFVKAIASLVIATEALTFMKPRLRLSITHAGWQQQFMTSNKYIHSFVALM